MLISLNAIALYFFWGLIGLGIIAPIFFVLSTLQAARVANNYHFRGYYKLKKEYYLKGARNYGFMGFLSVLAIACFLVMV